MGFSSKTSLLHGDDHISASFDDAAFACLPCLLREPTMGSICLTVYISPADRDDLKGSFPEGDVGDVNLSLVPLKVMREKGGRRSNQQIATNRCSAYSVYYKQQCPTSSCCSDVHEEVLIPIPSHGQAWLFHCLTASACFFAPGFLPFPCLQANSRSAEVDSSGTWVIKKIQAS